MLCLGHNQSGVLEVSDNDSRVDLQLQHNLMNTGDTTPDIFLAVEVRS